MQCNKIIESFMQLDSREVLPSSIKKHMRDCLSCKKEIEDCQSVFQSLQEKSPFKMKRDITRSIMEKISESKVASNISAINWFLVGIFILGSIPLIAFSEYILWMKLHFGGSLAIPLHVVMGLVISIYTCLFIGIFISKVKNVLHFHS